eukprot:363361-Chlamydomonas_euryale.AAC.14
MAAKDESGRPCDELSPSWTSGTWRLTISTSIRSNDRMQEGFRLSESCLHVTPLDGSSHSASKQNLGFSTVAMISPTDVTVSTSRALKRAGRAKRRFKNARPLTHSHTRPLSCNQLSVYERPHATCSSWIV